MIELTKKFEIWVNGKFYTLVGLSSDKMQFAWKYGFDDFSFNDAIWVLLKV